MSKPLLYYENNLISTFNLLHLLEKYDCKTLIFSSSATAYGSAQVVRQFLSQIITYPCFVYLLINRCQSQNLLRQVQASPIHTEERNI